MNKRLFIVFVLGFSSGLPLALLTSTLQAWFAESGMSILATGTLSLIALPYLYRVCWGPLLDRYSLFSLGKRRSWIICMQILLLLGFNFMAWLTPQQSPGLIAVLAVFLAFFSATQDMAIDAHRAEYLPKNEHGLGASLAVFGYRLALLLSGGLALVIAFYFGWAFTYRVMGAFMLLGLLAICFSQEPSTTPAKALGFAESFTEPLKDFFARPSAMSLVLFIFLYKLGEAFTSTTSGIVMPFLIKGLGFSLDTIGYVNKIMGISSIVVGGLLAGFILLRCSLYKSLLVFGLLQASTNILFVILAMSGKNTVLLAVTVISDNLAAGMGSTALVALFMRLVDKRFTGTQFSLLVSISAIPRVISGPLAASIQMSIGWVGLYQLSILLALLFIPFLIKIRSQIENTRQYQEQKEDVSFTTSLSTEKNI